MRRVSVGDAVEKKKKKRGVATVRKTQKEKDPVRRCSTKSKQEVKRSNEELRRVI